MDATTGARPWPWKYYEKKMRVWCNQTWPEVYRYVYYHVQNRQEAEDLVQETYARTLRRFSSSDQLPTQRYLIKVALNLIRDRWRRQKVHGTQIPLEETLLQQDSDEDATINRTLVRELMAQLSEEYRTVLQLRIVEGYSRAETARRMGRSEDAVRGLQYRAVRILRSLMLRHVEEVEDQ
ncbi:MAG TPA: sigma-70 family RNA polymerase sigma factor [Anaerolineae bacterium]|nr:sigma-70 family RNA polymerase sigma factor [Anaerolineae bacterium]